MSIFLYGEEKKVRKRHKTHGGERRRRDKQKFTRPDSLIIFRGRCLWLRVSGTVVRGVVLANRQTLNSYDDPDELSVVPIITASLPNLFGHWPNMLQTCSGIPLANTFDTCASYATRITDHWTRKKILMVWEREKKNTFFDFFEEREENKIYWIFDLLRMLFKIIT